MDIFFFNWNPKDIYSNLLNVSDEKSDPLIDELTWPRSPGELKAKAGIVMVFPPAPHSHPASHAAHILPA